MSDCGDTGDSFSMVYGSGSRVRFDWCGIVVKAVCIGSKRIVGCSSLQRNQNSD